MTERKDRSSEYEVSVCCRCHLRDAGHWRRLCGRIWFDNNDKTSTSDFPRAKKLVDAKNFTAAIPILKKVVKSQPKNADAWNLLAYSNRKLEKFDVALVQYQEALKLQPTHKGANEYLGEPLSEDW